MTNIFYDWLHSEMGMRELNISLCHLVWVYLPEIPKTVGLHKSLKGLRGFKSFKGCEPLKRFKPLKPLEPLIVPDT